MHSSELTDSRAFTFNLMPGLADMHVHLRMNPQAMFNLFIANGVTTIRNMRLEDGDVDHVELRKKVASGLMVGPRYVVSGPMITPHNLSEINEVVPMLERHINEGYDFVKIHEDLEPAVYDALIREADVRGLTVTGHAQHGLPLSESLRMTSIEHMEEFLYVSRQGLGKTSSIKEFLARYKVNLEQLANPSFRMAVVKDVQESGITIVPSLVIYDYLHRYLSDAKFGQLQSDPNLRYLPKSTKENYLGDSNPYRNELPQVFASVLEEETIDQHFQKNVSLLSRLLLEMHEAGVPILSGADAFGLVVPGFSLHQELALMVSAGLSPYEALKTATVNVARYLGEEADSGYIAAGQSADFILVDANPLVDILNARKVSGVFTHGMWHDKSALDRMLVEAGRLGLSDTQP